MSNLSYHQPKVELGPTKLLVRTIYAHQSYVSSVAFFGPQCDRLITGSYDETAKVCLVAVSESHHFRRSGDFEFFSALPFGRWDRPVGRLEVVYPRHR